MTEDETKMARIAELQALIDNGAAIKQVQATPHGDVYGVLLFVDEFEFSRLQLRQS